METYGTGPRAAPACRLPWKFSISVFLLANSGQPYNITTGLDPYNTGYPAARPALLAGHRRVRLPGVESEV